MTQRLHSLDNIPIPREINKPYISGSLYNQTNPSLATLTKDDHITSLSVRTLNSGALHSGGTTNTDIPYNQ
ncbi:hypothetical protein LS66_009780 [Helicobacter sp. MIT 03-1614]|uniref:VgrG protein n=1 Tax=Helicobacter typhlonius TaxID=76936 RepID=A0A4U8RX46_9HELI|nr:MULTISPECIES: hypothetical protein [Helicobacter]TLD77820.1 hypothetical protein LS75_009325 [Helicobacter typhlonius]TLD86140.1 hypothetical protein LS66_009780 [Helicobacter sp. MIT 03-1614]